MRGVVSPEDDLRRHRFFVCLGWWVWCAKHHVAVCVFGLDSSRYFVDLFVLRRLY